MRKSLTLTVLGASVLSAAVLVPGVAFAGNTTTVTFTLSGGSLTLTAPGSATLTPASGLGVTGTSVSGTFGDTTVSDARGTIAHTVTVNMSTTDFTDSSSDTIAKSNATAYSGTATISGVAVSVPTTAALPASIGNSGGATVFSMTGVTGSASAVYDATVSVTVPSTAVAGTYTGTVTQTAS